MPDVKRTVKLITEQRINPNKAPAQEGFPMRFWSIEVHMVNEVDGSIVPANMYDKVTYNLHPSFGNKATQTFKQAPFRISEEGWGEFDMKISLTVMGKGGEQVLDHDLNFAEDRYESIHKVVFKNPKGELLERLRESGTVPGDENGAKPTKEPLKKKSRVNKNVDMEKLAEGLQKLGEEDLLKVVQLVHDHKTADTYTRNDVENGEFHVDLYTLPDNLVKMLWDFCAEHSVL